MTQECSCIDSQRVHCEPFIAKGFPRHQTDESGV